MKQKVIRNVRSSTIVEELSMRINGSARLHLLRLSSSSFSRNSSPLISDFQPEAVLGASDPYLATSMVPHRNPYREGRLVAYRKSLSPQSPASRIMIGSFRLSMIYPHLPSAHITHWHCQLPVLRFTSAIGTTQDREHCHAKFDIG